MGFLDFLRPKGRPDAGWEWLRANTDRIKADLPRRPDEITGEINARFERIYPGICFEIAPSKDGPWSFCLSADGRRELFPAVEQAVKAAPPLPGWTVRAFRPRGSTNVTIRMGDASLGPDDVWCRTEVEGATVGLTLFIQGLTRENDAMLARAAVILLDNALGEYDAVMRVRSLERGPLPADPRAAGLLPLRELPAFFDSLPSLS
jgi:hypothetical protein